MLPLVFRKYSQFFFISKELLKWNQLHNSIHTHKKGAAMKFTARVPITFLSFSLLLARLPRVKRTLYRISSLKNPLLLTWLLRCHFAFTSHRYVTRNPRNVISRASFFTLKKKSFFLPEPRNIVDFFTLSFHQGTCSRNIRVSRTSIPYERSTVSGRLDSVELL